MIVRNARLGLIGPASLAVAATLLAVPQVPAFGQDTMAETRIRKMEAEIRALQRKVFPGGDGKFFEPEIKAGSAAAGSSQGTPTTTAVTDILARLDALEQQLARLTGQVEQNTNRIAQLEARAGIAAPGAAPAAATTATTSAAAPAAATSTPSPAPAPAAQSNIDAMTGGASAKPAATPPAATPAAKPSAPTSARLAAVRAVEKPQTNDPGDDEYSYGFRLWEAKLYPEAQQQLKLFLEKYPSHSRVSWGRNLLGRAYFDEGNPREAAKWFLQNYQADKRGGRAADSLLYLAVSMKQLSDSKRACIALAEFSETYAAEAAGRLKSLYDGTRRGLTCS